MQQDTDAAAAVPTTSEPATGPDSPSSFREGRERLQGYVTGGFALQDLADLQLAAQRASSMPAAPRRPRSTVWAKAIGLIACAPGTLLLSAAHNHAASYTICSTDWGRAAVLLALQAAHRTQWCELRARSGAPPPTHVVAALPAAWSRELLFVIATMEPLYQQLISTERLLRSRDARAEGQPSSAGAA